MNEIERKAAEVQLGVLKLQHLLLESQLKGDLPGHPFRGNQYSGGGGGAGGGSSEGGGGDAALIELAGKAISKAKEARDAAVNGKSKREAHTENDEKEGLRKSNDAVSRSEEAVQHSKTAKTPKEHAAAAYAHWRAGDSHSMASAHHYTDKKEQASDAHLEAYRLHDQAYKKHKKLANQGGERLSHVPKY